MWINIIGIVLGALIFFGAGAFFIKERADRESRMIYGVTSLIGLAVLVVSAVSLL